MGQPPGYPDAGNGGRRGGTGEDWMIDVVVVPWSRMARLPRATVALMLSLLPASAAVIGALVLRQVPQPVEIAGIGLVVCAVAVHQERDAHTSRGRAHMGEGNGQQGEDSAQATLWSLWTCSPRTGGLADRAPLARRRHAAGSRAGAGRPDPESR
jgi:hypothetical protein